MLIIFLTFFSGFAVKSESEEIKYLLRERTRILQDCYYGLIDAESAEDELAGIETYPILSEDIKGLREWEGTEVDIVEKMIFTSLEKKHSILGSETYRAEYAGSLGARRGLHYDRRLLYCRKKRRRQITFIEFYTY